MKKLCTLAFLALLASSCSKNEIEPVEGYNTTLTINDIQLTGLDGLADVRCVITREFIIPTDTTPTTSLYRDTLSVERNGYNGALYFNTPASATSCNLNVKLVIYGGNKAASASVGSIIYNRDQDILLEEAPVEMSGSNTDQFSSGIFEVSF